MAKRVSMIVLNYQGQQVLTACIDSLLAALGPDDEIVVVDNASADGSSALVPVGNPQVRLVQRTENNYIFGLNDGVAASEAEYVAFLNNDIVVEPEFIEAALKGFDDDAVFAVCPRIIDKHGNEQGALTSGVWKHGLIFYTSLPHNPNARTTFFAVGGQSFFKRSKLLELGSIDELFWPMYHEDIELSYRAWKAGWVIRYAPEAVVHHVGGHSSNRVFTKGQLRSFVRQNEYLTVWKNVTDRPLMVEHLALLLPRLVVAAAKRDWPTLLGFWNALRRLPLVRERRGVAKQTFRITDREVFAKVAQPTET